MDQEQYSFLHPLQFLQARLQAFTTSSTSSSQPLPPLDTSEVGISQLEEECSPADSGRTLVSRAKTSYQLAYPPPPKTQSRFLLRPRLLLQLRKVNDRRRAAPVLEVFTAQRSIRNSVKQHARERGQNPNTEDKLLVLSCDSYNDTHDRPESPVEASEDESIAARDVIASMHRISGGDVEHQAEARIYIGKEIFTITKTKNGGYEFTEDGGPVKAKWIPKMSRGRSVAQEQSEPTVEKKFQFTLLSPHARRHPIVGSMNRQTISIHNQYLVPDTPTSPVKPSSLSSASSHNTSSSTLDDTTFGPIPNSIVDTSEHTRILILVTGIWIAFAEGWVEMDHTNPPTPSINATPKKSRNFSSRTFQSQESNEVQHSPIRNPVRQRPRILRGFHQHTSTALPLSCCSSDAIQSTPTLARTRSAGSTSAQHTFQPRKLSLETHNASQMYNVDLNFQPDKPRPPSPKRSRSAERVQSQITESSISPRQPIAPTPANEEIELSGVSNDRNFLERKQGAPSRESRIGSFLGSKSGSRRKRVGKLLGFRHKKGEYAE